MRLRHRLLALLCLASGACAPTLAATDCSVSTAGIAFGTYDPTLTTTDDSTGTLSVTCTRQIIVDPFTIAYTIALSRGASNNYANRRMYAGNERLVYNIYTNASHALVWGDGTGSTQTVSGALTYNWFQTSNSANYTMYGRMPAQQSANPGTFNDSIVVTITF